MILRVHWPHRHVTDARTANLRAALAEHPGDTNVELWLQTAVMRLPVKVDPCRALRAKIRTACSTPTCPTYTYVTDPTEAGF